MPHRQHITTMPATREPASLLTVDRAVFELRRGRIVAIAAHGGARALVMAAEGIMESTLSDLRAMAGGEPHLALTRRRAEVLDLCPRDLGAPAVVALDLGGLDAETVLRYADPMSDNPTAVVKPAVTDINRHGPESAAIGLAKIARLLPAALVVTLDDPDSADLAAWTARRNLALVDAGDIFQYERTAAHTLKRVSEARVPLEDAERTRIIAYRPQDGGLEHLAIVIGEPEPHAQPLVRLHSECFTGDLLGSLRCDCGDQLRGAIQAIAKDGAGVLLYLAQEGRGIGLVNKLRAYTLQDRGVDTLDANEQLGYDADERVYLPAAEMLKDLGLRRVRLLTNNPDKVSALTQFGIDVAERVAHAFPSNKHNEQYLLTKKAKGGHLF
ncbi:MAG: GTP cyclohydrolase II [Alphaproteobacteria bacterium]|nr:GTP cyclohydrolase II [Alphaproteobacteria bacterium]MBF0250301.1 GTP cyclohydrolase II [Alphaproteobacteria bacterium]